jgi:arsenate reductase (thioredoxin)
MSPTAFRVLILCTGNSARSILAEAICNRDSQGRIVAESAGSYPKGQVHPEALALLSRLGYPTAGLRSKSWDEFADAAAAPFDAVITVCDNAAGEMCPIWPGAPLRAHWGIADPAAATGSPAEIAAAFQTAYDALRRRIEALAALPLDRLDAATLKQRLDEIGRIDTDATIP